MPILAKVKKTFVDSAAECRALFNYCLATGGAGAEAGIEGAFLQLFKSWENLLEESVIAYLCGRLACDGTSVTCYIETQTEPVARKILYQGRPYVEWSNVEQVRDRLLLYFPRPNRLDGALVPNLVDLRHTTTIRHAIAHTSVPARKGFQELVQTLFGGSKALARPAALLATPHPKDPARTFFDRYADVLEVAAGTITG
jgi:hypothetical protein